MKKLFLFLFLLAIFLPQAALAVCPVCTAAVGTCVGLARWIGVDDTITGVWVGGLIVSMIAWTISWLNAKNIRFYGRKILVIVVYYLLIILPLYFKGIIGHPLNTCGGVDKLLLGIGLGSCGFIVGVLFNVWLKKKNQGKVYFPFQKVVMPIAPLAILSLVFYLAMR